MRRGHATTAIEARVIGAQDAATAICPESLQAAHASITFDSVRKIPPTGKSVKAWHPVTLLRICTGVPDFF